MKGGPKSLTQSLHDAWRDTTICRRDCECVDTARLVLDGYMRTCQALNLAAFVPLPAATISLAKQASLFQPGQSFNGLTPPHQYSTSSGRDRDAKER